MPSSPAAPGPAGGPSLTAFSDDTVTNDERHAWDLYAAAGIPNGIKVADESHEWADIARLMGEVADALLTERRKRSGGGK